MGLKFVADVGGTNIRLAISEQGRLTHIRKYQCQDFDTIGLAIENYFAEFPGQAFSAGCIAIACPVNDDWIKMTNHSWAFSTKQLQQDLSLDSLLVINDFTSVAYSLPQLANEQLVKVGGGEIKANGNKVVFGPGTGLGVGHLIWNGQKWQALAGEGGHVDFAPVDEADLVLWRFLNKTQGRASAEELMSGPGIVNIYNAFCADAGVEPVHQSADKISQDGLSEVCTICARAMSQFCKILGSFAGNLALNAGAAGGVYIGGGIVSRFVDYFQQSDFRRRFEAKGRFAQYNQQIPTFLIIEPDHGLLGAAAYLEQQTAIGISHE